MTTTPTINLSTFDAYTPAPGKPGWFRVFRVDRCETCARPVEAANALTTTGSDEVFQASGLGRFDAPLPAEHWNDELDACSCERADCLEYGGVTLYDQLSR